MFKILDVIFKHQVPPSQQMKFHRHTVMYGCSYQYHTGQSHRLAEPVRSIRPEKGAGVSRPCWLGRIELAACTCSAGVVYSDLPELQRIEAQKTEKQSVLYMGSEAVPQVQLQRSAGKNMCGQTK